MRAVCWYGREDVRVVDAGEPSLLQPRDAVVKVTTAAICGSDLHLYDGFVPSMREGDILGHEFVGEVVETGPETGDLKVGDRVVVPFPISCGRCWYCTNGLWSLCDDSNPNAPAPETMYGYSPAGIYGYSHMLGGYAGGQAEYVRVPYADVCHAKLPDAVSDDQAVMLADVFPTGYQAAEQCDIQPGYVVAVFGAGPVGLFSAWSARALGAERVVVIDRLDYRLEKAREFAGAETLDYSQLGETGIIAALRQITGGRGPDAVIDAVGGEGHAEGPEYFYDRAKQALRLETDRPFALRLAIHVARKGAVVSVPGVYAGVVDKFPMGAIVNKALTLRSGQTHVQRYLAPLIERIQRGEVDPSAIVSHRLPLDEAPEGYRMFRDKEEHATKVLLKP